MIELMVALAILAIIMTLAAPRYVGNVDVARENVLKQNLYIMRDAIDKFYSDNGKYPDKLDDLVEKKYLRAIPLDPLTDSSHSWVVAAPVDPAMGLVMDVHSAAPNKARDGTWFKDW